jgi:UDP-glucose 4-epimerase
MRFAAAQTGIAEVAAFGSQAMDGWPDGLVHVAYRNDDDLALALTEYGPDVVVAFGPGTDGRPLGVTAAAVRAAGSVRGARLVFWGSTAVYGPSSDVRGRALLEVASLSTRSTVAAAVAADRAAQEVAAARPGTVHLFRAAECPAAASTPFAALGRLRVVPMPSGRRHLQLLDLRDALEVLDRAARGGQPGIYNVGADCIVRVDEACQALGRATARLPGALPQIVAYTASLCGRVRSGRELLRFASGTPLVDNARLKTHFGFRPRFTTRQALAAARDGRATPG